MRLRIAGIEPESVVDGPGVRYVIFTQGCEHHCPGCHNPHTHDRSGGEFRKIGDLLTEIGTPGLIKGVTFSGGEPFLQAKALALLGRELRKRGFDIVTFTGYLFEELIDMASSSPEYMELLLVTDWLIDGPFMLSLRDFNLPYRGSTNQRIIDVAKSLEQHTLVTSLPVWP